MIKYLFLLLPLLSFGQFYKYSTIYAGASLNATAPAVETYQYLNNQLIETTNENGYNYRYQIGIKKISRYKFEKKPKFYYDGTEKNASIYRSPIDNFEYVLQYERIKDRGLEFENYDLWFRYVGEYYTIKIQQSNNGYVNLQYKAIDLRLKRDFKAIRATFGAAVRNYPIYNINAFKNDFPNYNDFNTTISDLGYFSESSFIDANMNGYMDRWEQAQTFWLNSNGDTVANSTQQMQDIYSNIVSDYNRNWINQQGNQNTLSAVVGLSYYKYIDNFFILIYGNYFLYNHALTEYATTSNDYDFGMLGNWKLNKWFSFYSQLEYLKYFNRENYTINFGINLILI
tara:strand:+ start:312 stop:1337 length:1026 start_codon:yes stop_codon:yes gene_type:complete